MNLKFWKKKKATEESDNSAEDKTMVASEGDPTPTKPGFWTRLKSSLSPSRKTSTQTSKPEEEEQAEPSSKRKDAKHQDEESEAIPPKPGFLAPLRDGLLPSRKKSPPVEDEEAKSSARRNKHEESETPLPKPGFLARLKSALRHSLKKDKTEVEEKPEKRKTAAKLADKNRRDEEPEISEVPAKKPGKKLVIVLALLIPLAAGGGFFAATKLTPPPPQDAPLANTAPAQEAKATEQPLPEPTEASQPTPQPESAQAVAEPAPQQTKEIDTPAPTAEAPAVDTPAPTEEDVPTQIQAMRKHNQEMQAQIEALKKQPSVERPLRSTISATPREGVLIINGNNPKESAHGLKQVIEGMNAASGAKYPEKK